MLAIGDNIPSFNIKTDTGNFQVTQHDGKKMVIFFFPRANTSSCTKVSLQFSELSDKFAGAGVEVIGISKDTPQKQRKFRAKYGLKCHLGSDHETDVCEKFGVWVKKSMYGKTYMGIQRATFVVDTDGKIAAIWQKVKVDGHGAEVLDFVKNL